MNQADEKAIIRTLCTAGHEELAKSFARSRGYRVRASDTFKQIQNLIRSDPDVKALARHIHQEFAKLDLTPEDRKVVQQWTGAACRKLADHIDRGQTDERSIDVIVTNTMPRGGLPSDVGARLNTRVGGHLANLIQLWAGKLLV